MTRFTILLIAIGILGIGLTRADSPYHEQFRPQLHFTPPQRWMNDPNGLIYLDGEYHLFYQHHPYGNKWGPMHWGHAVSRDLLHWENLPIALYPDEHGAIFSGSAVVDSNNSSGLGSKANPPLIAIFTYHNHVSEYQGRSDFQTQGMAYSLDHGRTWTKYAGNPILANPGNRDFRDPQVSWYAAGEKWIMVLAVGDHVSIYSSRDLKRWSHESDFGQEWGTHTGVWECPNLVKMPVAGEHATRYALLVSVGSGGPNGGSATQYFIGDFDGTRFTVDPSLRQRLQYVAPEFPAGEVYEDFTDGLSKWQTDGNAFAITRTAAGNSYLESYRKGVAAVGRLRSRPFRISQRFINFRIGGGRFPGLLGLQLIVDGQVAATATGNNGDTREQLDDVKWNTGVSNSSWDVSQWIGKTAHLEVIDGVSGELGYTILDKIVFAAQPARGPQATPAWIDLGTDDYAGVTWSGVPAADGRTLFLGWMNNWSYGQDLPSNRWRGAMTLPRELTLVRSARGLELHSTPVAELATLRGRSVQFADRKGAMNLELTSKLRPNNGLLDVNLELLAHDAQLISLTFSNSQGEQTVLRIDRRQLRYELDRSASGETGFSELFPTVQAAPLPGTGARIALRIVVDHASLEIFANGGETVLTAQVFPHTPYDSVTLSADSPIDIVVGGVHELESIWH